MSREELPPETYWRQQTTCPVCDMCFVRPGFEGRTGAPCIYGGPFKPQYEWVRVPASKTPEPGR